MEDKAKPAKRGRDADACVSADPLAPPVEVVPRHKVGRHVIYSHHADAYDVLMSRHDCGAVATAINRIVDEVVARKEALSPATAPRALRVADVGCGTGRLLKMVLPRCDVAIAMDKEPTMLSRCVAAVKAIRPLRGDGPLPSTEWLAALRSPPTHGIALCAASVSLEDLTSSEDYVCTCASCAVDIEVKPADATKCWKAAASQQTPRRLRTADPLAVASVFSQPADGVDIILCGWALSFVMTAHWGKEPVWHAAVKAVVLSWERRLLDRSTGGALIVIETLGNFSDEPSRRNTLHSFLESDCGFERQTWMRTDYSFADQSEAERLCTFFFGSQCAQRVLLDHLGKPGKVVLKETTGMWVKFVAPRAL